MYHHIKKLMYRVNVGTPEPRFGNMLLEQFGGANGELAAAMQYSIQGLNCDDPDREAAIMPTRLRPRRDPIQPSQDKGHHNPSVHVPAPAGVRAGPRRSENAGDRIHVIS